MTASKALTGSRVLITGASRGIGQTIAERAAADGARVALLAKTAEPHPKLPGTLREAATAVEQAGGEALPIVCDIREEAQVDAAVAQTVAAFGGIDVCINNASAIHLAGTLDTPVKRFDLMHQVNARGTWMVSRACLPHLLQAEAPQILSLAPPPTLEPTWWGWAGAYTLAKMGMSFVTLALSAEFAGRVAVNALWPMTLIATAAVRMIPGVDPGTGRTPAIVADAAHAILTGGMNGPDGTPPNGRFFTDEEVLRARGVDDFTGYAVDASKSLTPDFWVPGAKPPMVG